MTSNVTSINSRSDSLEIPVRQMDFSFSDDIPKYWCGGDPVRTLLMTALSCTFPEGERMFIRAVRRYESQITDPVLKKQVRSFIGQEAHHGKEHEAFNQFMKSKGIATSYIESFTKNGIEKEEAFFSPERMLAKTCALEHFTAMFAETLLEYPGVIDDVDERLKPLWIWHAVEESEHKSVAFDVYQQTIGSYWVRSSEMMLTTVLFSFFSALHTVQLIRLDEESPKLGKSLTKNAKELWKNRKILGKLGRNYLSYYRPGFHPSHKDSSRLREQGLKRLNTLLGSQLAPSSAVS